jgi:hypothetical protein
MRVFALIRCPKCDATQIKIEYHKHEKEPALAPFPGLPSLGPDYYNTCKEEHLHYICECGYDWTGPTADSIQDGKTKEQERIE